MELDKKQIRLAVIRLELIKTENAVGHVLCHDITQIVRGGVKGARFHKGHVVTPEDIHVLLSLGKENLYVWERQEGMLHENDAAMILYEICAGGNTRPTEVREGKIEVIADADGLFEVDTGRLLKINSLGEIIIATRPSGFPVKKGDKLAGTRVIPLVISGEKMQAAKEIGGGRPLMSVLPFENKTAGIITTGSEVFAGRIEDAFTPVLTQKLGEYGARVTEHVILGDDDKSITKAALGMVKNGTDMVICSGGMSVDPDDRTPLAIKNTGARVVSYGAPVLPGAMFMLAYYDGRVPILGLPGCVMYYGRTVFDLILPKLIAGVEVTAGDIAALGHGGMCLNCERCTYPNCGFGKGR